VSITRRPHTRVGPRLYRYLDTGTFFVRAAGFDPSGRRIEHRIDLDPGTTLGQAMVARDELQAAIVEGRYERDRVRTIAPNIGALLDAVVERSRHRWRPATITAWSNTRVACSPILHLTVATTTYEQLATFVTGFAQNHAPRSVASIIHRLQQAFRLGVSLGWCGSSPAALLQPPRVERAQTALPSIHQLERAFAFWHELDAAHVAQQRYFGWSLIYRMMAWGGFRGGELLGLRWGDIDPEALVIRLPAERTKSHRAREIPILPEHLAALRRHARQLRASSTPARAAQARVDATSAQRLLPAAGGLVWPSEEGLRMSTSELSRPRIWGAAMRSAGIPPGRGDGVTPHMLRRVAVSRLLRSGMREALVRRIVGHSDPQMLALYDRPFFDELADLRRMMTLGATPGAGGQTAEHNGSVTGHAGDKAPPKAPRTRKTRSGGHDA